jgi:hypothetical protein
VTLIKIGTKIINLDNVTRIDLDWRLTESGPSTVLVSFAGPSGDNAQEEWLKDDEAEALRLWLRGHARDVVYERTNPR